MEVTALFKVSIVMLVFGLGLRASLEDIGHAWSRPRLVLRALFAIDVLIPMLGATLIAVLSLPSHVAVGMLLVAVTPAAPFAAQKELRFGGRAEFVFCLSVVTAIVSVVTIPLSLTLLSPLFVSDASVMQLAVARLVTVLFVVPLFVGAMLHSVAPGAAERLSRAAIAAGNGLIIVAVAYVLVRERPEVLALSVTVLPAIACLSVGALVIGHLLGGPSDEDRTALAVMCSMRHPGLALLIAAANFPKESVLPVIVEYLLVSTLVAVPYTMWRKRRVRAVELVA